MGFLEAHADIISPAGLAVMLTAAYLLVRNLVRSWTRSPVASRPVDTRPAPAVWSLRTPIDGGGRYHSHRPNGGLATPYTQLLPK